LKQLVKITCAVLALVLCCASCGGGGADGSSAVSSAVSSQSGGQTRPQSGTYFDTDIWQAVPMVSQALLNSGYKGGEGCQRLSCISFDPVDGKLAFVGTDTGGVFRSKDGGKSWEPCSIGLNTPGATAVAFDPHNTKRMIIVSSTSTGSPGLYMSEDGGDSWTQVYKTYLSLSHDHRGSLAFDETSKDAALGGSKVLYWLRPKQSDDVIKQHSITPGLYKSQDGGKSWSALAGTEQFAGGWLEVAANGNLFISNSSGIYRSVDGGKTFTQVFDKAVNNLCVIRTAAYKNYLYAMTNEGVYVSQNGGDSFANVTTAMPAGAVKNFTFLDVSPANPSRMVMQNDTLTLHKDYSVPSYYSTDGGKTWQESAFDKQTNVWAPFQNSQHFASFHPTDEKVAISPGGDLICRSADGGKSFKVSSEGYNVIFISSPFFFNVNNPNLVAVSSQDYNGGFSTDGGKTWNYVNFAQQGWGGFVYGAYTLTDKVIIAGVSDKWDFEEGSVQHISVTYDGGKTVTVTDYKIEGSLVACGAKGDNNIAFIGEWRTTDGAKTFTKMDGCNGVFYCDAETGWLFGAKGNNIVLSKDNGATWTAVFETTGAPKSIAYNRKSDKVFYCTASSNVMYFKLQASMEGSTTWYSTSVNSAFGVAVDPANPDVMYATCHTNENYNVQNVWRSLDGGKTWTGLARQAGDGRTGVDGANQAMYCAVNPVTHELFVATHCCGMWKLPAPPAEYYK
jgi:photosystem II stability/assembly factor-like uncharacterized protein